MLLTTLLVISLCGCVYSYALYPLLLALVPRRAVRHVTPSFPDVTLLITAHNEAASIADKLDNSLAIEYPGRLEIVVASDCSNDATDQIVGRYADRGVRLVRAQARLGKEHAQLCAIQATEAPLIVFSDVGTRIETDGISHMVSAFADPAVGAVSSEDRFISADNQVVGEGMYVRYEMWLRRLESERAGLVGLSGSFFAARREVCADWDIGSPSDFNTALSCARLGYVAVSDPQVVGVYRDIADPEREYQRKVRTVLRGITGLARHPEALSPARGWFAFQVFSHKVMRWLVPWFMLASLVLNAAVAGRHQLLTALLVAQLAFYAAVVCLHFKAALRAHSILRLAYFFAQVNLAIAHATVNYLAGSRVSVWTPSRR